jgi:hypothetical protein
LRYTGAMRTAVAGLVVAAAAVFLVGPAGAAPPEDVAAYCRAAFPQVQLQVRCSTVEQAAAERVSRIASVADAETFNRCLTITPSWMAMETCLIQIARSGLPPGAEGAVSAALPTAERSGEPPGQPADPLAAAALPGVIPPVLAGVIPPAVSPEAALAPTTSPAGPPPLLPAPADGADPLAPPPAAVEPERPPRPISEADADRHLRSVLERVGLTSARCTKRQYGPGWASICE